MITTHASCSHLLVTSCVFFVMFFVHVDVLCFFVFDLVAMFVIDYDLLAITALAIVTAIKLTMNRH